MLENLFCICLKRKLVLGFFFCVHFRGCTEQGASPRSMIPAELKVAVETGVGACFCAN